MLMNLAELAPYVRDVKPESDVHSNLPNHRSPLEKTMVSMLQMCLPLVRNQLLITSTPRLSQHTSTRFRFPTCVCRLCGTNSQQPVHRRHVFMNWTNRNLEPSFSVLIVNSCAVYRTGLSQGAEVRTIPAQPTRSITYQEIRNQPHSASEDSASFRQVPSARTLL